MAIFKFVWFVLFSVAYKQQVADCLTDQDEVFLKAYTFLKPLFIIEVTVWRILCGLFLLFCLCVPCFLYVFIDGFHRGDPNYSQQEQGPYQDVRIQDIGDAVQLS